MSRYTRKTGLQVQVETTYGTDPGSWAATHFVPILKGPGFSIPRDVVSRDLLRPYFGGSDQLVSKRRGERTFGLHLTGAGAAGSVPQYGPLLRAASMAQAVTAGNRVEYAFVTEAPESATFRGFDDGARFLSRGARGSWDLNLMVGDLPRLDFTFWGFDTAAAEASTPSSDFSAVQKPEVINDANGSTLIIGGTYSNGVVSSGTPYPMREMTISAGNQIAHPHLLTAEQIIISDREVTGRLKMLLTAAQEVALRSDINSNTTTTVGFMHGSGAGKRFTVFGGNVQRVDPQSEDYEGMRLVSMELRFLPVGTGGNDELMLAVR